MTDYIEKLNINNTVYNLGSDCCDGKPVSKNLTLISKVDFAKDETRTYDLSSYLPNDGCDYFVWFHFWGVSGTNASDFCDARIISKALNYCYLPAGTGSTSVANYKEWAIHTAIVPITTDRKFQYKTFNHAAYIHNLFASGYQKINKNVYTNNIKQINFNNKTLVIGGNDYVGKPVFKPLTIANGVKYSSQSNTTYDLSSYLPNDGYDYMVNISSWLRTGTAVNDAAELSITSPWTLRLGKAANYLASHTRASGGSGWIYVPASNRKIVLFNYGNGSTSGNKTGACGLVLVGYRRLGTKS